MYVETEDGECARRKNGVRAVGRTAWLAAVSVLHAFHGVLELRIATNGTCCYTEQIDRSRVTDSDSVSDSDRRRHAP